VSKRIVLGVVPMLLIAGVAMLTIATRSAAQSQKQLAPIKIVIPGEDRFAPFAVTAAVGQPVAIINHDTDSHYVVSNDVFNTAGNRGTNTLIPPGQHIVLTFQHPGVFPFYCSFHSMLDSKHQPKAPGPLGGIQDSNGNFGTPMNAVITVVPASD